MTKRSKEANPEALKGSELQQVSYIHYPTQFSEFFIETFIDLCSKNNAMQPSFVRKLGPCICKTNISAQKIDNSRLKASEILIASF